MLRETVPKAAGSDTRKMAREERLGGKGTLFWSFVVDGDGSVCIVSAVFVIIIAMIIKIIVDITVMIGVLLNIKIVFIITTVILINILFNGTVSLPLGLLSCY